MKSVATGLRLLVVATFCLNMTSSLVAMEGAATVAGTAAGKAMVVGGAVANAAYTATDTLLNAPFKAARWIKEKCPCLSLENSVLVTTAAGAVMATPGVVASCATELALVNALTAGAVAQAGVVPLTTALGTCGTAATTASGGIL